MARPTRQGVDYFSLDVHLDDKFKFVEIKYGLEGFAIIVKLMQRVYSQGYWCNWTDDEKLLFSDEIRANYQTVFNVVNEAIDRDVFDKSLYEKYGILTSRGIQKRYKEIVRRRKGVEVTTDYLLVDGNFGIDDNIIVTNDGTMSAECSRDDGISTQSKVKESKGEESKQEQSKSEFVPDEENKKEKVLERKSVVVDNDFSEALKFYRENLQIGVSSSPHNYELLGDLYDEFGLDVLIAAMKVAAKAEKRGIPYLDGILKRWREDGVKTIEDARKLEADFQNNRKGNFNNYAQNVPVIPVYEEVKPLEKRDGKNTNKFGDVQLFR